MPKTNQKDFDEIRKTIREMRPIDDMFFEYLMKDRETCQEVLRVILNDEKLIVEEVNPQKVIDNLYGRGVRLDVLCILGDGRYCNVEMQTSNNCDHPRRCRYNASCITANVVNHGEEFANIPDLCIIYITTFDVFGKGLTTYHARMRIDETGETLNDGQTYIFVNTKNDDGSKIASLMREFVSHEETSNSEFPVFSERKHLLWNSDSEEVETMCEALEKYGAERERRGKEEAEAKAKAEKTAIRIKAIVDLIDFGASKEILISKGYSEEEIEMAFASQA